MTITRIATFALLLAAPAFCQTPSFTVASIKPCKMETPGFSSGGGTKGGRSAPASSPGRLSTGCVTVAGLIRQAYVLYATGRLVRDPSAPPVTDGPAWIQVESYEINARAEGQPSEGVMRGPMLQKLLESRFSVRVRHESREGPVYNLIVGKGGSKLHRFKEGTCVPNPAPLSPRATALPPGQKMCPTFLGEGNGGATTLQAQGLSVSVLSKLLPLVVDRPVVDKTGIEGLYDFHLEFSADPNMVAVNGDRGAPRPGEPPELSGASIFTAIQEYGLKLESSRGPREFIVVDRVERPSDN